MSLRKESRHDPDQDQNQDCGPEIRDRFEANVTSRACSNSWKVRTKSNFAQCELISTKFLPTRNCCRAKFIYPQFVRNFM